MNTAQPVIALEGIGKIYDAGEIQVEALRHINLAIHLGELVAIMGASGSGKSTLLNILGCLDYPTSGTYRIDGVEVSSMSRDQLADIRNSKIGFVFQGFNLLARTSALENTELPLLYERSGKNHDIPALARAALTRVGLGDRMGHHPNQLSGGQQQRVAIARALIHSPSLILADEPTGNLDSRTGIEIMILFQELNRQGITIVLVTHEPEIARYCKRIVEFRDGRILRDVPVDCPRDARQDLTAAPTDEEPAGEAQ